MKVNYQGNRDAKIVLLQIIGEGTVNSFAQISSDILAEV